MSQDPKTHPIHAFSHDLVERVCALSPALATFVGVRGYDHLWDDFGPSGVAARAASYRDFSARLDALPPAIDRTTALAIRVHREHLDERLEFFASADPFLDLNHITSTFQVLTMVFDFMDQRSRDGLGAIATRLETFPTASTGYRALLAEGLASGRVVARRQVEAAIAQGRAKRAFGQGLIAALDAAAELDDALKVRLGRGADAAESALASLTDWLERHYLPRARVEDGVGRERYERAMRRHFGRGHRSDRNLRLGMGRDRPHRDTHGRDRRFDSARGDGKGSRGVARRGPGAVARDAAVPQRDA